MLRRRPTEIDPIVALAGDNPEAALAAAVIQRALLDVGNQTPGGQESRRSQQALAWIRGDASRAWLGLLIPNSDRLGMLHEVLIVEAEARRAERLGTRIAAPISSLVAAE